MKIIIEGDELAQALEAWVNNLGVDTSGKNVAVNYTAGRGVNGSYATVDITPSKGKPKKTSKIIKDDEPKEEEDPIVLDEAVEVPEDIDPFASTS